MDDYDVTFPHPQSSLAQLGIPLTDVLKVLVAVMLLGNVVFYEAKNQELAVQNANGVFTSHHDHTHNHGHAHTL